MIYNLFISTVQSFGWCSVLPPWEEEECEEEEGRVGPPPRPAPPPYLKIARHFIVFPDSGAGAPPAGVDVAYFRNMCTFFYQNALCTKKALFTTRIAHFVKIALFPEAPLKNQ